jgi:hypothetical protein
VITTRILRSELPVHIIRMIHTQQPVALIALNALIVIAPDCRDQLQLLLPCITSSHPKVAGRFGADIAAHCLTLPHTAGGLAASHSAVSNVCPPEDSAFGGRCSHYLVVFGRGSAAVCAVLPNLAQLGRHFGAAGRGDEAETRRRGADKHQDAHILLYSRLFTSPTQRKSSLFSSDVACPLVRAREYHLTRRSSLGDSAAPLLRIARK